MFKYMSFEELGNSIHRVSSIYSDEGNSGNSDFRHINY